MQPILVGEGRAMAEYSDVVARRRARVSAKGREQAKVFNHGASVAADVIALRLARGWTQSELAEHSGIDQGDISRIERGLANATEATLGRLAEALNAEVHLVARESVPV
jgi:ribosome-binding protein aMBF1 (putative translation factor)